MSLKSVFQNSKVENMKGQAKQQLVITVWRLPTKTSGIGGRRDFMEGAITGRQMGSKMSRRCESQDSMVLRKAAWAKKTMKLAQNGNAVQPRVAAVAERIARGQLRVLWPQAVRENRLHLRDEPGIHLDEGTYA